MMLIITGQSKNMQGASLLVFSMKNMMSIHTTLKHEDARKQQGQLSTASTSSQQEEVWCAIFRVDFVHVRVMPSLEILFIS